MQGILTEIKRSLDTIVIEDIYKYPAYTNMISIGDGKYKLEIEFLNPDKAAIEEIANLYHLSKTLKITSENIQKEHLDIDHIFVTRHMVDIIPRVKWDCISK